VSGHSRRPVPSGSFPLKQSAEPTENNSEVDGSNRERGVMVLIACILVLWIAAATMACLFVACAARADAATARRLASRRAPGRPNYSSASPAR